MIRNRLLQLLVLGLVLILTTGIYMAAKRESHREDYTPADKEYYLTPQEAGFIRPGLDMKIIDITFPDDMLPEVEFSLMDPAGLPLDMNGVFTPGPISVSFILSYIPADSESYVTYTTRVQTSPITGDSATQATSDSGGTFTMLDDGLYKYKFGNTIEVTEQDATHTLGAYARRDLREFGLDRYVDNPLHHFVPSGSGTPVPRDIVTTTTCNKCHDPLAIHGGSRREVGLCVLCHNSTQGIDPDTGNDVDMKIMTHKIHMGAQLPSVEAGTPYIIIGYRQGVHDYSEVEFPPGSLNECEVCHVGGTPTPDAPMVADPNPVPVCDGTGKGVTTLTWEHTGSVEIRLGSPTGSVFTKGGKAGSKETGKWVTDATIFYLIDAASGDVVQRLPAATTALGCVGNMPGAMIGVPATQHSAWTTRPSRATCGSCHDDVDFATGANHSVGIPVDNDLACASCHPAGPTAEYDTTVRGAHQRDYLSKQLPGVIAKIISVEDTAPGDSPTVTYSLMSKKGMINPTSMGRLRFAIVGPNEDFDFYLQEDVRSGSAPAGNNWTYTFAGTLPDDAEGSFSVGIEGRVNEVILNPGTVKEFSMRDQAENTLVPFAIAGAIAPADSHIMPRRVAVMDEKCEACHSNLSLHGDNRKNVNYCNTCHQPSWSDVDERPAEEMPAESIHMKYMIHKIHRGGELENGYFVYGHNGSEHDFGHIEYVGDLRNCEACHASGSYGLPIEEGALDTITERDYYTPMKPAAAACMSCHDSLDAASHGLANTTMLGESCGACHGAGKEFSVEAVHAR
jgi:hypothetical protein